MASRKSKVRIRIKRTIRIGNHKKTQVASKTVRV